MQPRFSFDRLVKIFYFGFYSRKIVFCQTIFLIFTSSGRINRFNFVESLLGKLDRVTVLTTKRNNNDNKIITNQLGWLSRGGALFDMLDSINNLRPCLSTFQPKWQNIRTFKQSNEMPTFFLVYWQQLNNQIIISRADPFSYIFHSV